MNGKTLAVGLAGAVLVGLLALSVPVSAANVVFLKCESKGSLVIDYDHAMVTHIWPQGTSRECPATVTAETITWTETGSVVTDNGVVGFEFSVNRDTGLLKTRHLLGSTANGTDTNECVVEHGHQERF